MSFNIKNYFYRNSPWIALLIATLLIISANYIEDNEVSEFVGDIGIAVLASGIFAAVLKSFQFSGLFREEIEKVVLSTKFLKKRNDLEELWSDVTRALYESKFPEISNDIEELILTNYLPTRAIYYYKDFIVTIKIHQIDDNDIVTYDQTCEYTLVPSNPDDPIPFKNKITYDKINGEEHSKNEILHFSINNNDIELKEEISETEDTVIRTFTAELSNHREYRIKKVDKRHTWIYEDNTKLFRLMAITKGMNVVIQYPESLEISFFNIGLVNQFKKKHVDLTRCISRIHDNGVILPFQGFGLTFRKT